MCVCACVHVCVCVCVRERERLSHFAVQHKLTEHCKSTIIEIIKILKKEKYAQREKENNVEITLVLFLITQNERFSLNFLNIGEVQVILSAINTSDYSYLTKYVNKILGLITQT